MTTAIHGGSAKIYQFPIRPRATVGGHSEEAKPATAIALPRVAKAATGSGWYHEEAIQEAERARRNLHPLAR